MYFAEPYYGYTPTQNPFYHPNMLAQQGHAFLADRSFSSPSPCLYNSHQQHAFTVERTISQASSTQNTYQPAYNLPPNQVQRKPATCGEPKFVSQELSPRIASSLPAYFRVKQNLTGQNGRRCRKSRTVFTELQLRILEKTFCDYKYLDTAHRSKIAHTLNLNETQVKTWFQNRRMKWKRESPEAEGTIAMERVKAKDCEIRNETNGDKNQSINFASF